MANPETLAFDFIDDDMAAVMREKSETERLAIAFRMWSYARKMLLAVVRREHPDWTNAQVEREAAHRLSHGAV